VKYNIPSSHKTCLLLLRFCFFVNFQLSGCHTLLAIAAQQITPQLPHPYYLSQILEFSRVHEKLSRTSFLILENRLLLARYLYQRTSTMSVPRPTPTPSLITPGTPIPAVLDNGTYQFSRMASYTVAPNTIVVAILGILLVGLNYVPFVSLFRAKNIPACTMIGVIAIMNFFVFLNAVIWPTNDIANWWTGEGLCDIEIYIRTMCSTLIATSTAGLTRNLAQAVDTDNPRLFESAAARRRRYIMELLFCFAVPLSQLVTLYPFVQAGRYAIVTVYGCTAIEDQSWPAIVFFLIWPPIFAVLNCYYASRFIKSPSVSSC
jgi:hypothetical protein